jgi:hypothetical protein
MDCLTPASLRLDKKCGASGIAANKKCKKSTKIQRRNRTALIGATILGGAILGAAMEHGLSNRTVRRYGSITIPVSNALQTRVNTQQSAAAATWEQRVASRVGQATPQAVKPTDKAYVARTRDERKTAAAFWTKPKAPYRPPSRDIDVSAAWTKTSSKSKSLTPAKLNDVSAAFKKY